MIKDRRVFLRMNLLQLKFRNTNLLLKMYTCVFISIKHVTRASGSGRVDVVVMVVVVGSVDVGSSVSGGAWW